MTAIPRAFTLLGSGPGTVLIGLNGQTITGNSSGAWAIAANGTNQNITLTASGTGLVVIGTGSGLALQAGGLSVQADIGINSTQGFIVGGSRIVALKSNAVLIGTGVDSSTLLQIGTNTTTNAGGIVFGTDTLLYRNASGELSLDRLLQNSVFNIRADGTTQGRLETSSGNLYISAFGSGGSLILRTNVNGIALTLDPSQNAAFSGNTISQGGAIGAVTTNARLRKVVTAIANAAATAVLTITVPNAAHSAQLTVTLTGSLGAGGAIGANEATGTIAYSFAIARTAGVNAVMVVSTAFGSTTAAVAGAATITITAVASAVSGAVGATNTFTVNATITRGSGASTNHTCQVAAELDNANATGITIA